MKFVCNSLALEPLIKPIDHNSLYGIFNLRVSERPFVWTNGIFDILHTGHNHLFRFCKKHGTVIVGVNSDESAESLNKSHPIINNEIDRATMVIENQNVDYVVIFDEPNPVACMEIIKPEYFIKGGDYQIEDLPANEKAVVESYGGKVLVSGNVEGKSNTNIWKYMDAWFSIAGNHIEDSHKSFMEVFHNGQNKGLTGILLKNVIEQYINALVRVYNPGGVKTIDTTSHDSGFYA